MSAGPAVSFLQIPLLSTHLVALVGVDGDLFLSRGIFEVVPSALLLSVPYWSTSLHIPAWRTRTPRSFLSSKQTGRDPPTSELRRLSTSPTSPFQPEGPSRSFHKLFTPLGWAFATIQRPTTIFRTERKHPLRSSLEARRSFLPLTSISSARLRQGFSTLRPPPVGNFPRPQQKAGRRNILWKNHTLSPSATTPRRTQRRSDEPSPDPRHDHKGSTARVAPLFSAGLLCPLRAMVVVVY